MRTIRNILLGLTAFVIGISVVEGANGNISKNRKSATGWQSIGPANISGRVLAIHVDINNEQKVYAGTAGGGLWVSTNGGASWSRCTGYTGPAAVASIAQDNNGRLYIGTGEGLSNTTPGVPTNVSDYEIQGNGIYASDDGGVSFSHLSASTSSGWGIAVNCMAFDKVNNKLYAGTYAGLIVSTDNGASFTRATTGTLQVCDLKVGSDGTVIYSVMGTTVGNVFVSTDNGATFASVTGASVTKIPDDASRISVAIAPSDPKIMYAFAAGTSGEFRGVYLSIDKGTTWEPIFKEGGYKDPTGGGGGINSNTIAVSPSDPNKILLGSYWVYSGEKHEDNYSWLRIIETNLNPTITPYYTHTIAYTSKVVYLGTESGIYSSRNDGLTYINSSSYLSNLQLYSFSVANDGRIIAGSRENGFVYLRNPDNSNAQGSKLRVDQNGDGTPDMIQGAWSTFSLVKPEALFYSGLYGTVYRQVSFESSAQSSNSWYGRTPSIIMATNTTFPRWYPAYSTFYPNALVSPLIMWESVNDIYSQDSILYTADKDYAPNDSICVKSMRNGYPIWIKNQTSDTLHKDSIIKVQDIVTSRMFLGGGPHRIGATNVGAPVYMSLSAVNATENANWMCIFRTGDVNEQVMDLVVSNDGDHLFILAKDITTQLYSIYRVSGFTTHRTANDIIVNDEYFSGNNPARKLTDDTLLYKESGSDILSITLDPQNNDRLVYTTGKDGMSRINVIENASTATISNVTKSQKEGTGIPSNISVYSAIVEMSNSNIAYIGTEEGVYLTNDFTSSSPVWTLYNEGIGLKVPVFKLFQQTKNTPGSYSITYDGSGTATRIDYPGISNCGIIYAATHGAGLFIDRTYWIPSVGITNYPQTNHANKGIKAYPNPTNSGITIDFALEKKENVQLRIVDITGKVILSENIGNREAGTYSERLDCSQLANGLYFVNLKTETQNRTAKIVISK